MSLDSRIHTDIASLMKLNNQVRGFTLKPRQNANSVMSGRHQSRFRGRGLNFEELRHYQMGDDIRTLDWRVTLRSGKPHVRAYSEEKDHQVVLCVDQRQSMYFSSLDTMKSVVAAHIASLCGWRVLADNDRIGALTFSDVDETWYKPSRSQNQFMRILTDISSKNNRLEAGIQSLDHTHRLQQMLEKLVRLQLKDTAIVLITDWHGCDDRCLELLKKLQRHNDVITTIIVDPMEQKLPNQHDFVASDGRFQLEVQSGNRKLLDQFETAHANKMAAISDIFARQQLPLIRLDTNGQHISAFRHALGAR